MGWEVTEPVEAGEILMAVPLRLLLGTAVALSSPVGPIIRAQPLDNWDEKHNPIPLAIYLSYAMHQPTSFWAPALKLMPRRHCVGCVKVLSVVYGDSADAWHPVMLSEAALQELQASPAKTILRDHQDPPSTLPALADPVPLQASVRALQQMLKQISEQNPTLIPAQATTLRRVAWLFVLQLSRALHGDGLHGGLVGLAIPTGRVIFGVVQSVCVSVMRGSEVWVQVWIL